VRHAITNTSANGSTDTYSYQCAHQYAHQLANEYTNHGSYQCS
jgi:hypothetical protein